MVFRETIALGKIFLNNNVRKEIADASLLRYVDIPAANDRLRRMNGTAREYHVSCSDTSHPISYDGDRLAEDVKAVAEETGRYVFLIGYSRGGLVARDALQRAGADAYVDTAALLATPNQGTLPEELKPVTRFQHRIEDR